MGYKLGMSRCLDEKLVGVLEDLGGGLASLEDFDVSKMIKVSFGNDCIIIT